MNERIRKRSDFWPTVAACFVALAILTLSLWPSSNDFTRFSQGEERKQAFIDYFAPLITEANTKVLVDRETALRLRSRSEDLGFFERRNLRKLAESYALEEFDVQNAQHWDELLGRVNTVPPSLALAQAANESAWAHQDLPGRVTTILVNGVLSQAAAWYRKAGPQEKLTRLPGSPHRQSRLKRI